MAQDEQQKLEELADFLTDEQDRIYSLWWEQSKEDADLAPVVSKQTQERFRNNIPSAIEELIRMMRGVPVKAQFGNFAIHGHHRWKQGFNLQQVVRDWGYLNGVLVQAIQKFCLEKYPNDASLATRAMEILSEFMRDAMSHSVHRFDELRMSEAASWGRDLQCAHEKFKQITGARSELLRQTVHDLRGGMNAVTSAAYLLNGDNPESMPCLLEMLDQGIASVNDMHNSLLDLSRLEAGAEELDLKKVDVSDLLRGLATQYQAMAAEKGLCLSAEGPDEVWVQTDPGKVRRIAQNLMVNAIQHTREGSVRLCWSFDPQRWTLQVEDTGSGITTTDNSPVALEMNGGQREKRIVAFSTNQPQGEGIGLTIVKHLCELLEASTWLKSEKGEGSTFTLIFPTNYDTPAEQPAE